MAFVFIVYLVENKDVSDQKGPQCLSIVDALVPFLRESKILGDSHCPFSKTEKQKALCYSSIKKTVCLPTRPMNIIILNVII